MRATPIFGNGWINIIDQVPIAPPDSFEFSLDESEFGFYGGIISEAGHAMDGMYVVFRQRYIGEDQNFNVDIFVERPITAEDRTNIHYSGYALIENQIAPT